MPLLLFSVCKSVCIFSNIIAILAFAPATFKASLKSKTHCASNGKPRSLENKGFSVCVLLTKKMQTRNRCAATAFKYFAAYRKVFWAVQKNYPKGHLIQVLPDGMFSSAGSSSL